MRIIAIGLLLAAGFAGSQQSTLGTPSAKPKQYITYTAEEQVVKPGKRSVVELRFHVADGFHVNSHQPKSELLIPTNLSLQTVAHVKADAAEYPSGTPYSFSFEPNEKLDVYTGTFVIKVPVTVAAGSHTVDGTLHYQACDNAACYPPKNLPVQILLMAK